MVVVVLAIRSWWLDRRSAADSSVGSEIRLQRQDADRLRPPEPDLLLVLPLDERALVDVLPVRLLAGFDADLDDLAVAVLEVGRALACRALRTCSGRSPRRCSCFPRPTA